MKFSYYDLKPSYRVQLRYKKSDLVILKNGRLANLEDGSCDLYIKEQFDIVKEVQDKDGKLIAIRKGEQLQHYDPILHDDNILKIKRDNNLISYYELLEEIRKQGYKYQTLDVLMNEKKTTMKILVDYQKKSITVWKGETRASRFVAGKGNIKELIILYKYLVDKKRNLFLYRYDVTYSLFK